MRQSTGRWVIVVLAVAALTAGLAAAGARGSGYSAIPRLDAGGSGLDAAGAPGRYKKQGNSCVWDANDNGPNQCTPTKGRFKKDGNNCYWDANDSGPNQCDPKQTK